METIAAQLLLNKVQKDSISRQCSLRSIFLCVHEAQTISNKSLVARWLPILQTVKKNERIVVRTWEG